MKYHLRMYLNYFRTFNFIYLKVKDTTTPNEIGGLNRIPNICFQTSKYSRVPQSLYLDVKNFRAKNPEFTFVLFNEKQMSKFMNVEFKNWIILDAFNNSKFVVMKADIFRYCFAYRNGGVYLDLTKYFSTKMVELFAIPDVELIISRERNEKSNQEELPEYPILNWCFAVSPNSPIILEVIRIVEQNFLENKGVIFKHIQQAVLNNTGTQAFDRGIRVGINKFSETRIIIKGFDFDESSWPKFKSASYLNILRRHYSDEKYSQIFS